MNNNKVLFVYIVLLFYIILIPSKVFATDFHNGMFVFYDPVNKQSCNSSNYWTPYNTNTTCYRWAVISIDNDDNLRLILDHNYVDLDENGNENGVCKYSMSYNEAVNNCFNHLTDIWAQNGDISVHRLGSNKMFQLMNISASDAVQYLRDLNNRDQDSGGNLLNTTSVASYAGDSANDCKKKRVAVGYLTSNSFYYDKSNDRTKDIGGYWIFPTNDTEAPLSNYKYYINTRNNGYFVMAPVDDNTQVLPSTSGGTPEKIGFRPTIIVNKSSITETAVTNNRLLPSTIAGMNIAINGKTAIANSAATGYTSAIARATHPQGFTAYGGNYCIYLNRGYMYCGTGSSGQMHSVDYGHGGDITYNNDEGKFVVANNSFTDGLKHIKGDTAWTATDPNNDTGINDQNGMIAYDSDHKLYFSGNTYWARAYNASNGSSRNLKFSTPSESTLTAQGIEYHKGYLYKTYWQVDPDISSINHRVCPASGYNLATKCGNYQLYCDYDYAPESMGYIYIYNAKMTSDNKPSKGYGKLVTILRANLESLDLGNNSLNVNELEGLSFRNTTEDLMYSATAPRIASDDSHYFAVYRSDLNDVTTSTNTKYYYATNVQYYDEIDGNEQDVLSHTEKYYFNDLIDTNYFNDNSQLGWIYSSSGGGTNVAKTYKKKGASITTVASTNRIDDGGGITVKLAAVKLISDDYPDILTASEVNINEDSIETFLRKINCTRCNAVVLEDGVEKTSGFFVPGKIYKLKIKASDADNTQILVKNLVLLDSGIEIPTSSLCVSKTYNGSVQQLVSSTEATGYNLSGYNQTNAGNYTITATLKPGFRWSDGTIEQKIITCSMEKKTLSVTADDKSRSYGAMNPEFTYTYSGQVSGERPAFTGELVTGATSNSDVGSYDIIQGTLTLADGTEGFLKDNYTISYAKGLLTINKATPVIVLSANNGEVLKGRQKTFNVMSDAKGRFVIASFDTEIATVTQESSGEIDKYTNNLITITGVNIGTSAITVNFIPTDVANYNNALEKTYTVEVTGQVPIPTNSLCVSRTYNGSEQILTEDVGNSGYMLSGNRGTNAGVYTITATLEEGYKWVDNTSAEKSFTCSIERQSIEEPSCIPRTYNGQLQTLLEEKTTGGYTNEAITGTNVGSYSKMLTLNSNYKWANGSDTTSNRTKTCTISKGICNAPTNVEISTSGVVSWTNSSNAIRYQISIGDGNYIDATNGMNYRNAIIGLSGTRVVHVRGICDSANYNETSEDAIKTVTVYKVELAKDAGITSVIGSGNYISGETVTINATAAQGYSFAKWIKTNGEESISTNKEYVSEINSNWNYKATSTANTYTITFDSNGGSSVESITAKYNTRVEKPVDPEKDGYRFAGWYSDRNLTSLYSFTTMPAENITLYAKWVDKEYIINYELAGGINNSGNPTSYVKGSTIILKDPTKQGYEFKGWYKDSLYEDKVEQITSEMTGDITLYAKWQINNYTITFDSNGGSSVESITAKYNTRVEKPVDPTKKGYKFAGWYLDNKFTQRYEFTTMPANNIVLYAKWVEDPVNMIQYVLWGGKNNSNNPVSYKNGEEIDLYNPTKEGYKFIGWYLDSSYKLKLTRITKDMIGNLKLYAKWQKISARKNDVINNDEDIKIPDTASNTNLLIIITGTILVTAGCYLVYIRNKK